MVNGRYNKFIIAVLGAASSGLTTFYGTNHWVPVVLEVLSAVGIALVPNMGNTATTPTPTVAE